MTQLRRRFGFAPFVLVLMVGFGLASCGAPPPPAGTVRLEAVDGPFTLKLEIARPVWRSGEALTGRATLSSGEAATLGGSSFLNFEYRDVSGSHHVVPADLAFCSHMLIGPNAPIERDLGKSGGFTAEDPDAAFLEEFLREPGVVRLPAGDWEVTAIASFGEPDCGVNLRTLRASARITVTP